MESGTVTLETAVICGMTIPVDRTAHTRIDAAAIADGRLTNVPSDHMFIAEYANKEWRKARIQPYRSIQLAPFALGLHYAQAVFEGMKAYRLESGGVAIFRIQAHFQRFNRSLERMEMPPVSEDLFCSAINTFMDADRDWVPPGPESAFYIRPLMFASEERMGLKSAEEFLFMIVGGPFRPMYSKHLKVKVERKYSRAAPGGTGSAKCAGNYAAAMYPTQRAREEGYDQVIWTDAESHTRIEESGSMNVAFIEDKSPEGSPFAKPVFVTPALTDTILDGITRNSVITLARDSGMTVEERTISVSDLQLGLELGTVREFFGIGTAASLAPIGIVSIDGKEHSLSYNENSIVYNLRKQLNDVRYGRTEDLYGWMNEIEVVEA